MDKETGCGREREGGRKRLSQCAMLMYKIDTNMSSVFSNLSYIVVRHKGSRVMGKKNKNCRRLCGGLDKTLGNNPSAVGIQERRCTLREKC